MTLWLEYINDNSSHISCISNYCDDDDNDKDGGSGGGGDDDDNDDDVEANNNNKNQGLSFLALFGDNQFDTFVVMTTYGLLVMTKLSNWRSFVFSGRFSSQRVSNREAFQCHNVIMIYI